MAGREGTKDCADDARKVNSLSRIVPRCSCHGELVITGEIRTADGWRTGFSLECKQCGKKWTYSGGVYREAETGE